MRSDISFWSWDHRMALIFWISLFVGLGPGQLLLHNTTYEGSIFGNNPFAYFMLQGLFIATFAIGIAYLVDWLVKRRKTSTST